MIQTIINAEVMEILRDTASSGFADKDGRLVLVIAPKDVNDIEEIGADLERHVEERGGKVEARFSTERTREFAAGDY